MWDLLFGCGLLYALIFVCLGAVGLGVMQGIPLGLLPMVTIFASAPHYGATLLRVYEHRDNRHKYAFFAVGITALLGAGFVLSLFEYVLGSILVTVYFKWNSWHYAGQNYGLAVMFLRRRGIEFTPEARRLLYASFILSSALAIVALNGEAGEALYGRGVAQTSAKKIGPVYHFLRVSFNTARVRDSSCQQARPTPRARRARDARPPPAIRSIKTPPSVLAALLPNRDDKHLPHSNPYFLNRFLGDRELPGNGIRSPFRGMRGSNGTPGP